MWEFWNGFGPFILNYTNWEKDSNGTLQDISLHTNEYSWNKKANLLVLEPMLGLGFSQGRSNNDHNTIIKDL